LLDDYNQKVEAVTQNSQRYLRIINRFHADSGKCVEFDDRGYLSFSLDDDRKGCDITTLSSGEAQIFVIMTHLFFNPDVQGGNVFIIDEPELSLHVQWQEHFVESVLEANAKVQYIFATHSPSIILDKTKNCVDLSRRKRK
jgi:predicted ATP-binding protein involved in virulence